MCFLWGDWFKALCCFFLLVFDPCLTIKFFFKDCGPQQEKEDCVASVGARPILGKISRSNEFVAGDMDLVARKGVASVGARPILAKVSGSSEFVAGDADLVARKGVSVKREVTLGGSNIAKSEVGLVGCVNVRRAASGFSALRRGGLARNVSHVNNGNLVDVSFFFLLRTHSFGAKFKKYFCPKMVGRSNPLQ
jgi:hypothetical protein